MLLYFCIVMSYLYQLNHDCDQSLDKTSCCHTGSWQSAESNYWITGRICLATIHLNIIRWSITCRKWHRQQVIALQPHAFVSKFWYWAVYQYHLCFHLQSVIMYKKPILSLSTISSPHGQHVAFISATRISLSEGGQSSPCALFWKDYIEIDNCMGNCFLTHGCCMFIGKSEVAVLYKWLEMFRLSTSAWNTEK
jgi:hypothetical protein